MTTLAEHLNRFNRASAVSMMKHAVGGGWRNHYCAEKPSLEWSQWSGLVTLGLAKAGFVINDGRDQYFHVSDKGREYLKELETATKGQP